MTGELRENYHLKFSGDRCSLPRAVETLYLLHDSCLGIHSYAQITLCVVVMAVMYRMMI